MFNLLYNACNPLPHSFLTEHEPGNLAMVKATMSLRTQLTSVDGECLAVAPKNIPPKKRAACGFLNDANFLHLPTVSISLHENIDATFFQIKIAAMTHDGIEHHLIDVSRELRSSS